MPSGLLVVVLRYLRFLLVLAVGLGAFGYVAVRAARSPDAASSRAILTLTDKAPRFVLDTLANLTGDSFTASRTPDRFSQTGGFMPVANHTRHRIEGLVQRRGPSSSAPADGWRLVEGVFRIDGEPRYAALALSPAMAIEHVWLVDRADLDRPGIELGQSPFIHGLALLSDGSIVTAWDTTYNTIRIAACGGRTWLSDAKLNHAVQPLEGERLAWGPAANSELKQIDLATGKTVRTVTLDQIAAANADISAIAMLRIDDNGVGANDPDFTSGYHADPFHMNDAEPLPAALAAAFPQFAAGDLLISLRSPNLIFVLDPASLRIKWLTNAFTFRQHDPDWEADGTISVFDNQMGRQFSRILSFDPKTGTHRTLVDGRTFDFYSRIRGKHQSLPQWGMLITAPGQGRIFELGADHRIALELLDLDPASPGKAFSVTEAAFFPSTHPAFERLRQCPH